MRQCDIYKLAVKLLREQAKAKPNRKFKNSSGETVTISEIANELDKVSKWVYSEFTTEDVEKVVRCKNCRYYKLVEPAKPKHIAYHMCTKYQKKQDSEFFCKDGETD